MRIRGKIPVKRLRVEIYSATGFVADARSFVFVHLAPSPLDPKQDVVATGFDKNPSLAGNRTRRHLGNRLEDSLCLR